MIGIIDADLLDNGTRHPNLALMKISGYYKSQGMQVSLLESYNDLEKYERVFVSKVFNFTKVPNEIEKLDNVTLGGTGFYEDGGEWLDNQIEHHKPDYDLYNEYISKQVEKGKKIGSFSDYMNYSIGFTTRGCFRKCDFCVNKKYDRVFRHSSIKEFLDEKKPYIYLWDDNILGFSGWEEVIKELNETGKPFQFRQGLDIRLMTDHKAKLLSHSRYHGDFIFAFDHIEDRDLIEKKLKLWKRYCTKTTKLYVLCAFDSQDASDIVNTFERIRILMKYGCLPYIMRYEEYLDSEYKSMYIQLARWCNQPNFFKKKSFRQFCETNQQYHKTEGTNCSAYQAMIDFETKHPDIAKKYFDLRYEDINEYKNSFGYGRKYAHKNDCEVCRLDQKRWIDAYHGLISEDEVIKNYFMQEMDLQCLSYDFGLCQDVNSKVISDWFVSVLSNTSIIHILKLIAEEDYETIQPALIPQFSKLDDAIIETVDILVRSDIEMKYEELGYYLNGKSKSDVAKKKYGENHSKFATLLDLAAISNKNNVNFIRTSVLGISYYEKEIEVKKDIASKLLLRIPIIQHIMRDASYKKINLEDYLLTLSPKTMTRRLTNIKGIIEFIYIEQEEFVKDIITNILGE